MKRSKPTTPNKQTWTILGLPPILFFVVIVLVSVYFGFVTQGNPSAIVEKTTEATPYILLIVQLVLLALFLLILKRQGWTIANLAWLPPSDRAVGREITIGIGVGIALGLLYAFVLSPFLSTIQQAIGDYVPPGSLSPALNSSRIPFFVANVLLAPFVEESIYRGYALANLKQRYGSIPALVIVCFFFGLLHWAGGVWYILLTGLIAGGILGGLFLWRKNLLVAFIAHLALNLVEFVLL